MRSEDATALWRDGEQRLSRSPAGERDALERVTDVIVSELRRRLGGPFTVEELAGLYGAEGTDWCFELATRVAPGNPSAWDMTTVAGAAFARYAREARDYRFTGEVARPPGMEPE